MQPRASVICIVFAASCSATLALPDAALAAGPATAAPDQKAVEVGFAAGNAAFERGDYATALKKWSAAASILPETPEHRANRAALYELMASIYEKELERLSSDAPAHEALAREAQRTLDDYAQSYNAAYPDEALPLPVAELRERVQGIVAAAEARESAQLRAPPPKAEREPTRTPPQSPSRSRSPPAKPWKSLAVGGGVAIGVGAAMLGVLGGGVSLARNAERDFDDPANGCTLDEIQGACADIDARGKTGAAMATAGLVTAPLFIGAGVAMMVIAARRRAAATRSLAPVWSPTMAGLVFEQRF